MVYEVFFYFIFSFLILLKPIISIPLITTWVIGILTNSIGIINLNNNFYSRFIFSNYDLEFIMGCVVSYLILKAIDKSFKYQLITLLVGLSNFAIGWYLILNGILIRGNTKTILIMGFASALILFSFVSIDLKYRKKIPRLFVFFGDASYSIYLTHYYILLLMFKILTKITNHIKLESTITITFAIVLTCMISSVFYIIVEKPLLTYIKDKLLKEQKISITNQRASNLKNYC